MEDNEINVFSSFDFSDLDSNMNSDFMFIFQAPFLSTEEKIKIQNGLYKDFLNNKEYYNERYIVFAKYKDENFKFIGTYKNKEDVPNKYKNKKYTKITLQINSEITSHIFSSESYHTNNLERNYRDSNYAICGFSFSPNNEDDENERVCENLYLIDEGSNSTDFCLDEFYDFQNMCFSFNKYSIEPKLRKQLEFLKSKCEEPFVEKIKTYSGVTFKIRYELKINFYMNIGPSDYVLVDSFILRIPIVKTCGKIWSPKRLFCYNNYTCKKKQKLYYIVGTDIIDQYYKQSIPINMLSNEENTENPTKVKINIQKIPLLPDEEPYKILYFRAGTIFIKFGNNIYAHPSKSNKRTDLYITRKILTLVCFTKMNEFKNYCNSDLKENDGAFIDSEQDEYLIFINDESNLEEISQNSYNYYTQNDEMKYDDESEENFSSIIRNINLRKIGDTICGSGFFYSKY